MILDDDEPAPADPIAREIGKAVAIAFLSGLASGVAAWIVEELKARSAKKKGAADAAEGRPR